MFKIINKQTIGPNIKRIEVEAQSVADKANTGQFVMVVADEQSERIPLSIIHADRTKGRVTLIFKEEGLSTRRLGAVKIGDSLLSVLGPLGRPVDIENYGVVACVGHAVGIAQILPICRSLKKADNKVIGVMGAETKRSILLETQMRLSCHKILMTTEDGSYMRRGSVTSALRELLDQGQVDCVYAMSPLEILEDICRVTRSRNIKTFIGLQPRMIDGTGICGSCRVKVSGREVSACTEGPYFNGHQVDFRYMAIRTGCLRGKAKWHDQKSLFNQKTKGSKILLKSIADSLKSRP